MRRILILFVAALTLCLASCGTDAETEKKLDGTWVTTKNVNCQGLMLPMTIRLTLNNETKECQLSMSAAIEGVGDFINASVSGTWSATSDEILLETDSGNAKVELAPSFRVLAIAAGQDPAAVETEISNSARAELSRLLKFNVSDLTENSFVSKDDADTFVFTRRK